MMDAGRAMRIAACAAVAAIALLMSKRDLSRSLATHSYDLMIEPGFGFNPDAKLIEHFSNDRQVTAKTPPTFLAHAKDDRPVPPDNSRMFYDALRAAKVPSEYLELPSGGHGLNGYMGAMWDLWQDRSLGWLADMKLVPENSITNPKLKRGTDSSSQP